jgi:enterochelin esterase-like enzyme
LLVAGLELLVGPANERARHGASLEKVTVDSVAVGEGLNTEVLVPKGADEGRPRPLLVFLHGRGDNGGTSNLNEEMYDAVADQGERAPIVAFPDGGEHSYWHDRDDGDWGRYVIDEVIPRVAEDFDADADRVAIGGISMGGFGALDLARLNPGHFCAVGAHSPAIWHSGAETAEGAFDDVADFERHDVLEAAGEAPGPYVGLPVWVDAGNEDEFRNTGVDEFAASLRSAGAEISFHIWPGEHNGEYWRSHYDDYLRFYSHALAHCN